MNNTEDKIVDFKKYCPKCEYKDLADYIDPCNECLYYGANYQSDKPVKFKERDS